MAGRAKPRFPFHSEYLLDRTRWEEASPHPPELVAFCPPFLDRLSRHFWPCALPPRQAPPQELSCTVTRSEKLAATNGQKMAENSDRFWPLFFWVISLVICSRRANVQQLLETILVTFLGDICRYFAAYFGIFSHFVLVIQTD